MQVYINDMVIKSYSTEEYMIDLTEIFEQHCRNKLKLNPEKCTFGEWREKNSSALYLHPAELKLILKKVNPL